MPRGSGEPKALEEKFVAATVVLYVLYHNFMVPAHVTRDFGLSLVSGNYFVTTDFDVDMIHFFAFQTRTALLVAIFATALSTSEALIKVRPIFVAERMSMNVKGELAHNLSLQHIPPSLPLAIQRAHEGLV